MWANNCQGCADTTRQGRYRDGSWWCEDCLRGMNISAVRKAAAKEKEKLQKSPGIVNYDAGFVICLKSLEDRGSGF